MPTKQHVFEVTLVSGFAEAVMLIAADNVSEAKAAAHNRLAAGDVCWEGVPLPFGQVKLIAKDQGEDEGQ